MQARFGVRIEQANGPVPPAIASPNGERASIGHCVLEGTEKLRHGGAFTSEALPHSGPKPSSILRRAVGAQGISQRGTVRPDGPRNVPGDRTNVCCHEPTVAAVLYRTCQARITAPKWAARFRCPKRAFVLGLPRSSARGDTPLTFSIASWCLSLKSHADEKVATFKSLKGDVDAPVTQIGRTSPKSSWCQADESPTRH